MSKKQFHIPWTWWTGFQNSNSIPQHTAGETIPSRFPGSMLGWLSLKTSTRIRPKSSFKSLIREFNWIMDLERRTLNWEIEFRIGHNQKCGLPANPSLCFPSSPCCSSNRSTDKPKSVILTSAFWRQFKSKTLSGLISLWITPLRCMAPRMLKQSW